MTDREPVEVTNLDRYGFPPLPWSRPRDLLAAGPPQPGIPFFLGTSRPDGRPHAAGIGAHGPVVVSLAGVVAAALVVLVAPAPRGEVWSLSTSAAPRGGCVLGLPASRGRFRVRGGLLEEFERLPGQQISATYRGPSR